MEFVCAHAHVSEYVNEILSLHQNAIKLSQTMLSWTLLSLSAYWITSGVYNALWVDHPPTVRPSSDSTDMHKLHFNDAFVGIVVVVLLKWGKIIENTHSRWFICWTFKNKNCHHMTYEIFSPQTNLCYSNPKMSNIER